MVGGIKTTGIGGGFSFVSGVREMSFCGPGMNIIFMIFEYFM